jgi:hypothetical protein
MAQISPANFHVFGMGPSVSCNCLYEHIAYLMHRFIRRTVKFAHNNLIISGDNKLEVACFPTGILYQQNTGIRFGIE